MWAHTQRHHKLDFRVVDHWDTSTIPTAGAAAANTTLRLCVPPPPITLSVTGSSLQTTLHSSLCSSTSTGYQPATQSSGFIDSAYRHANAMAEEWPFVSVKRLEVAEYPVTMFHDVQYHGPAKQRAVVVRRNQLMDYLSADNKRFAREEAGSTSGLDTPRPMGDVGVTMVIYDTVNVHRSRNYQRRTHELHVFVTVLPHTNPENPTLAQAHAITERIHESVRWLVGGSNSPSSSPPPPTRSSPPKDGSSPLEQQQALVGAVELHVEFQGLAVSPSNDTDLAKKQQHRDRSKFRSVLLQGCATAILALSSAQPTTSYLKRLDRMAEKEIVGTEYVLPMNMRIESAMVRNDTVIASPLSPQTSPPSSPPKTTATLPSPPLSSPTQTNDPRWESPTSTSETSSLPTSSYSQLFLPSKLWFYPSASTSSAESSSSSFYSTSLFP